MARLFRPYDKDAKDAPAAEPEPVVVDADPRAPRKKGAPTPRRRDAQRARMERVNPTLSPKEAKKAASRANRERRMEAMAAADSSPEKLLMRDLVDSRFSLGEILLPSLLLVIALTFLQSVWPQATLASIIIMYGFIALVILDLYLLSRRYKKLLAERMPGTSTKGTGVLRYGWNRAVQMRRIRMPQPRVKRGEKI